MSKESPASPRSGLLFFLALLCAFVIAYISLEPFQGWSAPEPNIWQAILTSQRRSTALSFDFVANFLAYVPLGFALMGVLHRWGLVLAVAALFSIALELCQTALPTRHASVVDCITNVLGAMVGVAALAFYERTTAVRRLVAVFRRFALPGIRGDFGVILIVVFLVGHLSPGLSFFSSTFFVPTSAGSIEPALAFLQILHTAMTMLGIGLFADLVARNRVAGGVFSISVLLLAITSKATLAVALLRPGVWGNWLSAPVLIGLLLGAGLLLMAFWMPAPRKRIVCNVVVIVALLLPALAPEWLFARAPLRAFDWNYGHLLNFNSLSQTLLRIWPLFASAYLFSTAGNPYQDRPRHPTP